MLKFGGAVLDESVFLVSEATKLTISNTNANDKSGQLSSEVTALFIFKPTQETGLSDQASIALAKMIEACGLKSRQAASFGFTGQDWLHFNRIASGGHVKQLVLLGITPGDIHLYVNSEYYNIFKFNNIEILISDNIEGITKENKQALWARLQALFKLK